MLQLLLALSSGTGLYFIWHSFTAGRKVEDFPEDALTYLPKPKPGILSWVSQKIGLELPQVYRALFWGVPGGLVFSLLSWLIWGWPTLVILSFGVGFVAPLWYLIGRENKRRVEFAEDLAEALEIMRMQLQYGGYGIASAFSGLAESGPERLRGEFRRIYEDTGLYGLKTALKLAQERLANAQFDLLALALITSDRAGSPVSRVLETLVTTIQANQDIARQGHAEQVKTILSARLVAFMPRIILTFLKLNGSDYTDAYSTPPGQFALLIGLSLMFGGYAMMRFLARIPPERRGVKSCVIIKMCTYFRNYSLQKSGSGLLLAIVFIDKS
jgi:tight adherence protein B